MISLLKQLLMKNTYLVFILCSFFFEVNAQIPEGKSVISSLYVYDLSTGQSKLVTRELRHFEAPNWSRDGQYFLINAYGKLEKMSMTGDRMGYLNTGSVQDCNNDHGFSFDGKDLFISSGKSSIKEHSSFIFKVPANGGEPVQLTPTTPSYWHGISPDGKTMVYCAARNGNYDVYSMSTDGGEEKRLTTAELFSSVFLELKEKSLKPELPGLASGFYDLDSLTQGFQKSDLIILAGRPSMGKTAFVLNIAENIIKKYKVPILFFSLEMSKEQLIYRLLANETGISQTRLKIGNLYKEDWHELKKSIQNYSRLPFFIDDQPNLTTQDIRSKIKQILFEQNKIGFIIIDYLQLLLNSKLKSENRVQELSQITRDLKNLAKEFQIPVIALSQLSRNVENRINKRPVLSDLRESGSIEQDADLVLMLYRENYYNSRVEKYEKITTAELIIAKHRNGPLGTVELSFQTDPTKFFNTVLNPV